MSAAVKREPFAAVPQRAFRSLEAHELTLLQVGLLAYLLDRCGKAGGSFAMTLAGIAEQARWPQTKEKLRKDVRALADAGWIVAVAPLPGSTSPWKFARPEEQAPTELQIHEPPPLELPSNEAPSGVGANGFPVPSGASNGAPTKLGPTDTEKELLPDRPVGSESLDEETKAALDLYAVIREKDRDEGTKHIVLVAARETPALELRRLRAQILKSYRDAPKPGDDGYIRDSAGYVVETLNRKARERWAAR